MDPQGDFNGTWRPMGSQWDTNGIPNGTPNGLTTKTPTGTKGTQLVTYHAAAGFAGCQFYQFMGCACFGNMRVPRVSCFTGCSEIGRWVGSVPRFRFGFMQTSKPAVNYLKT